jgi:hypothetical protein
MVGFLGGSDEGKLVEDVDAYEGKAESVGGEIVFVSVYV